MSGDMYTDNPEDAAILAARQVQKAKEKLNTMDEEDKALILKEALRGVAHPEKIKETWAALIIKMFVNVMENDGQRTPAQMCEDCGISYMVYYRLLQSRYGPSVKAWLDEMTKTIISTRTLPLLLRASKEAGDGSVKHLDAVLEYLGLKDGDNKDRGQAMFQFVDKFVDKKETPIPIIETVKEQSA